MQIKTNVPQSTCNTPNATRLNKLAIRNCKLRQQKIAEGINGKQKFKDVILDAANEKRNRNYNT